MAADSCLARSILPASDVSPPNSGTNTTTPLTTSQATESFASVCSFVLCDSSTFLKFWLEDKCRDAFLSFLPKKDLANLRLACHDSSVRAAPALFSDLKITFKASTFTKPARLAALDRLGFYVKTLTFDVPHTSETTLPPLIEPETGEELSFTYTPQVEAPTATRPKYGDLGTTEILTRQWPTLFHAATNVPAFIRAFSAFVNLSHLKVSCPGYETTMQNQRTIVDYALISVRIAVERTCLNGLEQLTLAPIHPGGLLYLSPVLGYGATPRSASRWRRIKSLSISMHRSNSETMANDSHSFKLLQTYIRNFQSNVTTFKFAWLGDKGPMPTRRSRPTTTILDETRLSDAKPKQLSPLHFPKLEYAEFENCRASSRSIRDFAEAHQQFLAELNLEDMELTAGTWNEALAPLIHLNTRPRPSTDLSEIPIMLSPTTLPSPMARIEVIDKDMTGHRSMRMSRWLPTRGKGRVPSAAQRMRDGLMGCEEQLRKVLRGSVFPRR